MSTVYVVQNPHHWNAQTQQLEPRFDLKPAEKYGDLVFLLGAKAAPFNSDPVIEDLNEGLAWIQPEDYLLLIGNPALIGFAAAIAAQKLGGKLRMLQWSGKDQSYTEIKGDLHFTF